MDQRHEGEEKVMMLLPGPPQESKALSTSSAWTACGPAAAAIDGEPGPKNCDDGGAQCDARLAPIYKRYTDVQTTTLAGAGEIELT